MSDTAIPAPTNELLNIVDTLLDFLVKGLGATAAIAACVAAEPVLATPWINYIFTQAVNKFAAVIDQVLEKNLNSILIRFQKTTAMKAYNASILSAIKPGVSNEELETDLASIDKFLNANS